MKNPYVVFAAVAWAAILTGCATPGGDGVRVTRNPADVANCSMLGHIDVPRNAYGDVNKDVADRQFRSRTRDLGGNTTLVSIAPLGAITDATAYSCQ